MEILDNTEGKRLGDSLRANLDDEAKLSIISAHFSLFAFGELREELERLDSVRFLFSEPTFIQDMGRVAGAPESDIAQRAQGEREKALADSALELSLHNKLNQRALARACASWLREKVTARAHAAVDAQLHRRGFRCEAPFVLGTGRHLHPGGTGS